MTSQPQRRRSQRREVSIEIRVDGIAQNTRFRLADINHGGGFVDSPAHVRIGDCIRIVLLIDGQHVACTARVIHVQQTIGFGFAFEELTDDARDAVQRLLSGWL
jgi:hypothetical protein